MIEKSNIAQPKKQTDNFLKFALVIGLFGGAICILSCGFLVMLYYFNPASAVHRTSPTKITHFVTMKPYVPEATSTPDMRSDFEKCAQSGYGVRYVLTGRSGTTVSLTWQNDTNGTQQGEYRLPFCMPYDNFMSGDFLYVSAQITSDYGDVECVIYDGDNVVSKSNASGFASITTCSGSK